MAVGDSVAQPHCGATVRLRGDGASVLGAHLYSVESAGASGGIVGGRKGLLEYSQWADGRGYYSTHIGGIVGGRKGLLRPQCVTAVYT